MGEAQRVIADGGICTSRGPDNRTGVRDAPLVATLDIAVGSATVTLGGELDLATAPIADGLLQEAAGRASVVVLDLRRLSFIDCAGLRAVVNADTRLRQQGSGRRLVIVGGGSQVQRVFELTGVNAWLNVVGDSAAAGGSPSPAAGAANGLQAVRTASVPQVSGARRSTVVSGLVA